MQHKIFHRLSALVLVVALLVTMVPAAMAAEGNITVKLNYDKLTMTAGQQETLTAKVLKNQVEIPGATVEFVSGSPDVASVNPTTGVVTAKNVDQDKTAQITAVYVDRDKNLRVPSAPCMVTVKAPAAPTPAPGVEDIMVTSQGPVPMEVGATSLKVIATVLPTTVEHPPVHWISSDPSVATVDDATGIVTAVAPGETMISAQVGDVTSKFPLEVAVSGLRISEERLELVVGKGGSLSAQGFGLAEGKTVNWSSSNIAVANVSGGRVAPYHEGTATITAFIGANKYPVTCEVTVKENMMGDVHGSMDVGQAYGFSRLMGEIRYNFSSRTGNTMEYLTSLSVPTNQGILYYGYSSPDVPGSGVGGSEKYYVNPGPNQKRLDEVYFVPNSDFGGDALISYTAYGGGQSLNGRVRVHVENAGDVAYNTADGRLLSLETSDFTNVCQARTGKTLSYVTFQLPPASKGTLYYQYSSTGQYSQKVTSSGKYYVNGGLLKLENVSFMPAKGFVGTVRIPYYGTDTSGGTYSGNISIQVNANGQHGGTDVIHYTCAGGSFVSFDDEDFQIACVDSTGSSLDYVYFTQPDSAQGKLYYKYVSSNTYSGVVSESTRYYRHSNPRISAVAFVPAENFFGSVTVPYIGYSATGEQFTGEVVIRVNGTAGNIHYSTSSGRPVDFNGRDFNEVCQNSNGAALDRVRFDLPSSLEGTLYYNYHNSSNYGSKVSTNSWYTVSSLSDITFVPERSFSGTVTIPFSGYDSNNDRFRGEVAITVDSQSLGDAISYNVMSGGVIAFDDADFNRASEALTGDRLDYVTFTPPAQKYGKLYYRYNEEQGTGTTVSSGTNYYRSGGSRLLEDVSFVADRNYSGTLEIPYTGKSTGGERFDGVVTITVTDRSPNQLQYYTSALPVKFSGGSFQNACSAVLPARLSYIQFQSLPSSYYGKLMVDYDRPNSGRAAQTGVRYYVDELPMIDSLTFIPKAGYEGAVSISYTAVDVRGNSVDGTVMIYVTPKSVNTHFTDLGNFSWAAPSIEYLYQGGIVKGYSDTQFGPAGNTSRGAFVLMICRLFRFAPRTGEAFRDVPVDSPYYAAVVTAKELGIVSGDDGYFRPKNPVTRQQAVVMLARAMKAAGWSVLSSSSEVLSTYADGNQVSDYARSAMASMIRMGILRGDKNGNLNPHKPITRAEMSVILHRLLTY